jgi:hypothetical protein
VCLVPCLLEFRYRLWRCSQAGCKSRKHFSFTKQAVNFFEEIFSSFAYSYSLDGETDGKTGNYPERFLAKRILYVPLKRRAKNLTKCITR